MLQNWKSRDVKWIASFIVTLQEPKLQTTLAKDNEEDNVHAWAQVHGVNVIPDYDNASIVVPIEYVDKDDKVDSNKEDQAVACPMPATNKML